MVFEMEYGLCLVACDIGPDVGIYIEAQLGKINCHSGRNHYGRIINGQRKELNDTTVIGRHVWVLFLGGRLA